MRPENWLTKVISDLSGRQWTAITTRHRRKASERHPARNGDLLPRAEHRHCKRRHLPDNTVTNYQKGGITVSGNVSVTIANNTMTGQGAVNYIAQNGIQVGYGAQATVTENIVTGNAYTGAGGASSGGIIVVGGALFGAGLTYTVDLKITKNTLTKNDVGVFLVNADANGNAPTRRTDNSVKSNTITNEAITNTSGNGAGCGYQAGISDFGTRDLIVNNSISGAGYTPVSGDCSGTPAAFVRFIDADPSAHLAASNK